MNEVDYFCCQLQKIIHKAQEKDGLILQKDSHNMSWMRSGTYLSQFLRVFLPTLKPQVEEIIAEEQDGLRARRKNN